MLKKTLLLLKSKKIISRDEDFRWVSSSQDTISKGKDPAKSQDKTLSAMGSDRRREEISDLETGHTVVLLLMAGGLGAELSQGEEALVRKSGKGNKNIAVTLRKNLSSILWL